MTLRTLRRRQLLDLRQGESADPVRDVSEDEFEALIEQQGRAFSPVGAGTKTIRLWDAVDEAWTMPLPANQALDHHIRKMVAKCSACKTVHHDLPKIVQHIAQAVENGKEHDDDAKIEHSIGNGQGSALCTGCGQVFISRPGNARKHIERARENGLQHKGATSSWMLRFRTEPPAVSEERTQVTANLTPLTPELEQKERSLGRRRRSRSHGRNRRTP